MTKGRNDIVLIAGGGLAGSLAALAIAEARPDVQLLLIEEGESFGGDQVWGFFDDELDDAARKLVEPLVSHSWPGFYVAFPGGSRKFKAGYGAVRPEAIDQAVRGKLRPDQYRTGVKIVAVRDDAVILQGGERIKVDGAIDARTVANLSLLDAGWEHRVGREYRFEKPHRVDRPVLIDATVDQSEGFRYFHCLPYSSVDMLVEERHFSELPACDVAAAEARLDSYVTLRGWGDGEVRREDAGMAPIAFGGDFPSFWRVGGARVAKIGIRGGLFHPATGEALADAARAATLLAQQSELSGAALHDLFEAHALSLWKKREPYRAFNAALHRGAAPKERHQMLDRLYQLGSGAVTRFHAGQSTMIERMRIAKL